MAEQTKTNGGKSRRTLFAVLRLFIKMRVNTYKTLLDKYERVPKLVRESARNYSVIDKIKNADDAWWLLCDMYNHDVETEEVSYLLCLDTRNVLIGVFELSRGTVGNTAMNPREIIFKALMTNAVKIIVAHNHPSGDVTPSNCDIDVTKRLKEACDVMGLTLMDHIIIGENCYLSMKECDFIPKTNAVQKMAAEK